LEPVWRISFGLAIVPILSVFYFRIRMLNSKLYRKEAMKKRASSSIILEMSTWRVAGMNYLQYSQVAARAVRSALKEEFRVPAKQRSTHTLKTAKWENGKAEFGNKKEKFNWKDEGCTCNWKGLRIC